MLFVIVAIIAIAAVVLSFTFDRNDYNIPTLISAIIAFPTAVAAIIMLIALIITWVSIPNTEAKWQEQYASLNERIEQHMYYPWDRAQLIQEVQKWNEDFAAQERSHNDFWVGIFNPESIEGLSKIDLTKIK